MNGEDPPGTGPTEEPDEHGYVPDAEDEGYDVELGARPLKRAVERRVATAVARALFEREAGRALRLSMGPDGLRVQSCAASASLPDSA